MITLYHCFDARSFRPLWTLEELGLPYRLAMLPFPPRVLARDYLSRNPLGTIPLLIDGATQMTESAAICQYLATQYGPSRLAVSPEEGEYGMFLNYLHFGEAPLTFPQTIVLRYAKLEPEGRRLPQAAEDYRRWFLARLRAIDAIVSRQDTLCERFTVADISVGYALLLAGNIGLSVDFPPAVASYWKRLQARDGFQRAQAAQRAASETQGIPHPLLTSQA